MKNIAIPIVLLLVLSPSIQSQKKLGFEPFPYFFQAGDCEYNGIRLYGKVEFVDHFPDIKIQYVESFPDIRVKFVDVFADECGEWRKVNSFPDFKVQVVTSFPDLKVEIVDAFPGMED